MKKKRVDQKIMLDVGCGHNKQAGYVGMDKRAVEGVDIVHDVEVFPWPLDSDSCAVIVMSHLVEHIKPWLQIDFFNEAWRVLIDGGFCFVATPHARSYGYLQDPTHCAPWNESTPDYFCPDKPLYQVYRPRPWKIERLFYNHQLNIEVAFKKIEEGGQK